MRTSHGRERPPLQQEQVVHALESRALREIVSFCIKKARSVKEISDAANLPLASTYRQVHLLVDLGLLVIERSALTEDGKPFDLFRSCISSARLELRPDGLRVTWDPNDDVEDKLASLWGHLRG